MYYIKKAFLNFLLNVKNFLSKSSKTENLISGFKSENSKVTINQAASLEIKSKSKEMQKEVEQIASKIVKNFDDVTKTLKFLETKKVRVYRIKSVSNVLKYVGEKTGFITPNKGFKAFYLNFVLSLLCDKKIVLSPKSAEMFVFSGANLSSPSK